jgi:membrane protease YdiL (CAAX protease family)
MTILLGYLFKVRFRDFNWDITVRTFLIIAIMFILLNLTDIVEAFKENNTISYYVANFAQKLFYPSIVEEVIFRGFLLSGLLAFNIREDKANIIQAILFGLIHLINYNEITVITVLLNCLQMYIGFIIGKIYIKTKSLTPCMLLHALLDTV